MNPGQERKRNVRRVLRGRPSHLRECPGGRALITCDGRAAAGADHADTARHSGAVFCPFFTLTTRRRRVVLGQLWRAGS